MNLDKNTIKEAVQAAKNKAVDVVNSTNSPVNKATEATRDAVMAVVNEVSDAEMAEVGSVEVKKGEGAKEIFKGGLQYVAGAVKTQVESSAKGVKGIAKGMEAAKDLLINGDTEGAKAKLKESRDGIVSALEHGTLGQVRNVAQAAERQYKGAKELGKGILGLEQVQTDWAYERPRGKNGWYMSDAA